MTGRMVNETWGRIHFGLTFIGLNMTFLPMHQLGLQGMNRRIAMYDPQYQTLNVVSTIGSYLLAVSTIFFVMAVVSGLRKGAKAGNNPWRALTLEWQTTSPPAIENFNEEPILWSGPYDYGIDVESIDHDQPLDELLAEVKADVG